MVAHGYFLVRHWRCPGAVAWFTKPLFSPVFSSVSTVAGTRIRFASPWTCLPTSKGPDGVWLCLFHKNFVSHINPGISDSSLCQSGRGRSTTTAASLARSCPGLGQCRSTRARHFISLMKKAQVSCLMQWLHPTATSQGPSGQN